MGENNDKSQGSKKNSQKSKGRPSSQSKKSKHIERDKRQDRASKSTASRRSGSSVKSTENKKSKQLTIVSEIKAKPKKSQSKLMEEKEDNLTNANGTFVASELSSQEGPQRKNEIFATAAKAVEEIRSLPQISSITLEPEKRGNGPVVGGSSVRVAPDDVSLEIEAIQLEVLPQTSNLNSTTKETAIAKADVKEEPDKKAQTNTRQKQAENNGRTQRAPSDRRGRRGTNPVAELLKAGPGILERALLACRTLTGLPVNPNKVVKMSTKQDESRKKEELSQSTNQRVAAMVEIMNAPFNDVSVVTENIGLTGVWGIVSERLAEFPRPVRCVINATYEAPLLTADPVVSYRIPVADNEKENLIIYLDEVTQKMHDFSVRGQASVVHCMAGVSRSASIVIAYLMRYHAKMKTLENAFAHAKAARSIVRPNVAFLRQLADYEAQLHGEANCSPWLEHTHNGVTKRLPEFILKRFFDDYQNEFE